MNPSVEIPNYIINDIFNGGLNGNISSTSKREFPLACLIAKGCPFEFQNIKGMNAPEHHSLYIYHSLDKDSK